MIPMRLHSALAVLLIAAAPLVSTTAAADLFGRGGDLGNGLQTPYVPAQREPPPNGNGAPALSPNEAARRAQEQNDGGRVLSVEASGPGYRVKLLRDGEVRVIYVQ